MVLGSIGIITALNPILGYETCTTLAKEASKTGKSVYELILEKEILTKEQLELVLDPENMLKPRKLKFNK